MKKPVRVAVTGAAGQISYSMLFRIAAGNMLGPDQPVELQMLEISPAMAALNGVAMELDDCAFPTLAGYVATDDPEVAFGDADYILLVGARPRGPGMERGDLLEANAAIFTAQGSVIDQCASNSAKILVVGNPANTNALITASRFKRLDRSQVAAMTRLDHNRAISQLASKANCASADIAHVCIWGNHSATQYPDIHHATINGAPALEMVGRDWMESDFIPRVQKRGAEIIEARGLSSAASAGSAAIDHMRIWNDGTPGDEWTSAAVACDGSYGIAEGLVYSFPVTCRNGAIEVVQDLEVSDFSAQRMKVTEDELIAERDAIRHML